MKSILRAGVAGLALSIAAFSPALAQDALLGDWGVETQHVSETLAPGDDFFRYVNEGWLDSTEIPAGFRPTPLSTSSIFSRKNALRALSATARPPMRQPAHWRSRSAISTRPT
ncbi:hypothetical protein [Maricaulis sp.]|uniref:hypothetical protein n=1 Tax=Maricaulis sp. TaxID=1486257 RepID=UPI0025EC3E61|nr:hypothetical protein [Maricaulis sp.]MDF1768882.1 hypothetical protein [Maricaulis sp.]